MPGLVLPVPDGGLAPESVSRDVVLFQLVLHEAAGNAEQFGGVGLHEVGAHERALDERRLNLVQRVGQVELHGQQIHGALELRFLAADFRRQVVHADDGAGHHDHAAFQHVLKLPDVL